PMGKRSFVPCCRSATRCARCCAPRPPTTREEQAQVWKKHKPKKGQTDIAWHEVARALAKRRMPASAAQFGEDLAKAYGIVWEDDLFAPPGEDSRYTTNVEAFFGAQQEWLKDR